MAKRFASQERIIGHEARVLRQPLINRLIHWGIAISILSLFLSGFGQMPIFKRYGVADLPGLAWMANFGVTLAIHYAGFWLLAFVVAFHVVFHGVRREFGLWPRKGDFGESFRIFKAMLTGGKEPPSDKYLAEQRIAYAFIALNVAVLIATGLLKVADNHPAFTLSEEVGWVATTLHNISTMFLLLGIVSHLVAFVVPANRELLGGVFHGKVDLAYVEHRHCLWCDRLRALYHHNSPAGSDASLDLDNASRPPDEGADPISKKDEHDDAEVKSGALTGSA